MIYTVTFNPSLDYIVSVDDFRLGRTNRTETELILPGGKGMNVSIVLKNLGLESVALGFIAGFTGREIAERLDKMGLETEFLRLGEGMSRINLKLRSVDGTEINGQGPEISREMTERLLDRLEGLEAGDVLVLAGSIPASMPSNIYEEIMGRLSGKGILTVVDAAGDLLVKVLPYGPFLVKPNLQELGEIFGAEAKTWEEAVPGGKKLQELGAKNVMISMGGKGAVLLAENGEVFHSPAPKGRLVNSVGSGDSMVAGFLAGWLERKDYRHAFYMGIAAGSASAFSDYLATKQEIMEVYSQLEEGKKGRIINQ